MSNVFQVPTRSIPAAAALLCAISVSAADPSPELVTDRPDQTESAVVVPRGYVQLETGWTHAESGQAGDHVEIDSVPDTLVRIGLSEIVELRVGFFGYRRVETPETTVDGWANSAIGMKIGLRDEAGWRPQLALLAGTTLPTGDSDVATERASPNFRFAMSNPLTERLSIGYNLGMLWTSDPDENGERDTLSSFTWTASLGIGATDRLGFYVELFGVTGLSANGGPANGLNGGLTYLLKDDLQLDGFVGVGLSDASDDWFAGIGLSYRFG